MSRTRERIRDVGDERDILESTRVSARVVNGLVDDIAALDPVIALPEGANNAAIIAKVNELVDRVNKIRRLA